MVTNMVPADKRVPLGIADERRPCRWRGRGLAPWHICRDLTKWLCVLGCMGRLHGEPYGPCTKPFPSKQGYTMTL